MRRRLSTLCAVLLTALAVTGGASAAAGSPLTVGVNDAAGIDPAQAGWFFPTLASEGLQVDSIALRWDDAAPTTVPDVAQVQRAADLAAANGVTIELDLFPLHSQVFTGAARCAPSSDPQACGDTARIDQFAAWTATVARTFPAVHEFVVMNECNQPLFVNPQWDASGQNQSAEICGRALVASYDALKAVSPQNVVWGVGLSPRGNDNPNATSNSSTSPVAFLQDLGAWFRAYVAATGRTAPLMDGLDFHPYPIPQSQPFAQGYQDPDDASVSNLPRIYQAFYQGFQGTPQPTIGQQAGGGLPVSLNEVGIQTDSTGRPGYAGTETSATPAGGLVGQYGTEAYQASWYGQMLNLLACDPNVRIVDVYHLIDEASLAGWQSGLYYVDRTPKQSAAAVHDWIATTGGLCQGAETPWTPAGVAAAPPPPAASPAPPSAARVIVAVGGRLRVFDAATHRLRRVLAPFGAAYTGPLAVASARGEIAVATGAGHAPEVRLLAAQSGKTLARLTPFARSARGGLSVALDATAKGKPELVVGTGPGAPAQVKVYDGKTHRLVQTLTPFGVSYRGGVAVAAADLNGDGTPDLVTGSGTGMRARVEVWSGATGKLLETLFPFGKAFRGGVSVAAANLAGGRRADLVVGSGPGIAAEVRAYAGPTHVRLWSLEAFAPGFTGGVSVAAAPLAPGGPADVVAGAGAGGGSQVKVLDGKTHALVATFLGAPGSAAIGVAAG